jgi:hypothetical protein
MKPDFNRITPQILVLAKDFSRASDAEDDAWVKSQKSLPGAGSAYRQAIREANVAFDIFRGACDARRLDANEVFRFLGTFSCSPGVVLPNGTEIPWPA